MADAAFDPADVFDAFDMKPVRSDDVDQTLIAGPGHDLRCLFLWGNDCYHCNRFKQAALIQRNEIGRLGLSWFEGNVYQDEPLGRRFGLHGVPAFVFFQQGRRLGRITGWPGLPEFSAAVRRLRDADQQPASPHSAPRPPLQT
ncbi:thioredoxin [Parapusillimonas sp. SGNA-6]|nr:thioredoxin [Parapusillimonas sp. SGNA-6]